MDNLLITNAKQMDKKPKVSVLVPVYNVEKYLRICLDSLLCQTLRDIEIICIDDGSTDHSSEILAEYAAKDARIVVITKENTGYGASMNMGLRCAGGEYIGIVESDDYALPEMFEQLYIAAKKHDAEMVKANYYQVFSGNNKKNFIENLNGLPYEKIINPLEELELFSKAPTIWSGIYRNDFLKNNKILFHETPGASFQDISFAFFVLFYARRVVLFKEAYLCYRYDNEGSSVKSGAKVFCVCDEMERIENLIGDKDWELQRFMQTVKFNKYLYNYDRIDSMYQYAFLMRMHFEWEEAKQAGLLQEEYWDKGNWQIMEEIRTRPEKFFRRTNRDYMIRYQIAPYTLNRDVYKKGIFDEVNRYSKVVIYGAGVYGRKAFDLLHDKVTIYAFAVTDKEGNEEEVNDIPVYKIDTLLSLRDEMLIVVAVNIKNQTEIVKRLWELEFQNIVTMDEEIFDNKFD